MKHLLIILSILLLSSPVIGNSHKGETLYRWETSTDIFDPKYIWKGFGDKETHPIYKGDVKNGKPNGLGILIYTDGTKYVGSWEDGKMNGQGKYTWKDGEKDVGKWKNDKIWNGMRYYKDGKIWGNYVNGKFIKQ